MKLAVSFDYGQTLAELDAEFLAGRLLERGIRADVGKLEAAVGPAWQSYNRAKRDGAAGKDAWCSFMDSLLGGAVVETPRELSDWLWSEQARCNLWRKPIAGMLELVRELHQYGVPLAVVSNSEGRLRELAEEMGLLRYFATVVDSGLLDFEKPDRRMFELAAQRLGTSSEGLVHVGDSWEADVLGALGAGARAIWLTSSEELELPSGAKACSDAAQVRQALVELGVPIDGSR